jgi:hypothetical protein
LRTESVRDHKNVEQVIRYYLGFLPPRDCESILDIGSGTDAPYRSILKNRCKRYAALDIRPGPLVDYVADCTNMRDLFDDNEWQWGWCTETIEHVPPGQKENAVIEIMRVCENCIFTYPTPAHPSFYLDPGHSVVKVDFRELFRDSHFVIDNSTKTGRAIITLKRRILKFEKRT